MKNLSGKATDWRGNMKSALKFGLVLTVFMFGSMTAYAQIQLTLPWSSYSGAVCQQSSHDGNHDVKYSPEGFVERDQAPAIEVWVTCPLIRATQNVNGAHISVYVTHNGSQDTFCKAYSEGYNSPDSSLAFDQASFVGSGNGKVSLNLAYNGASNALSYYVVSCRLPGSGQLKSILLQESF